MTQFQYSCKISIRPLVKIILLNALYGGQSFCGMSAVDSNNPWIDEDGGRAARRGVSYAHDNNMAINIISSVIHRGPRSGADRVRV